MLTGFLSQNIFDILAIQSRITSCPILAQEKLFHCRKVCQILTNKDTNQSHFLLRWFFNYLHIMWKSCLEVKLVLSFVTFFRLISFLQITWNWLITLVAKSLNIVLFYRREDGFEVILKAFVRWHTKRSEFECGKYLKWQTDYKRRYWGVTDMRFVKKITRPDFQARNFTHWKCVNTHDAEMQ